MAPLTQRIPLAASAVLLLLSLFMLSTPAAASDLQLQGTTEPTPTPGADGRILYTVIAGDTQWGIAAKFGMPVESLQNLNGWSGDEVLVEGQTILLGLAGQQEPTATSGPEVAATLTPQVVGTGSICVLLFDDVNGDAMRQETEFGIANGQASVNERTGLASRSEATQAALDADGEPVRTCFTELPLGEYTVSVAIPDGYNPTTAPNTTIQIAAGQTQNINFGAQAKAISGVGGLAEGGSRSPLMGLLGIVLLLGGAGLGFYTFQLSRRRTL